eukprot:TRINITY_DN49880_c0_g1_i1.p1 TRINITY_DN49880_c0_g1~~TRINITY_DN49880_c0_g1_i1.p1  ORF type:complete len:373 (+),score=74.34 TRINITY_DN49880_c0_g1_i1:131-1249(+)
MASVVGHRRCGYHGSLICARALGVAFATTPPSAQDLCLLQRSAVAVEDARQFPWPADFSSGGFTVAPAPIAVWQIPQATSPLLPASMPSVLPLQPVVPAMTSPLASMPALTPAEMSPPTAAQHALSRVSGTAPPTVLDDGERLPVDVVDALVIAIASILSSTLFLTLVACIYVNVKVDPQAAAINLPHEDFGDGTWHYNLFQCMHNPRMCIFTCFFPAIRWSDTMRLANLLSFWTAFFLVMLLVDLTAIGLVFCAIILLCLAVYYRQALRKMFALPYGTFRTVTLDCLTYGCCCICAIVQEAQQVEGAWRARHPAVNPVPGAGPGPAPALPDGPLGPGASPPPQQVQTPVGQVEERAAAEHGTDAAAGAAQG